MGAHEVTLEEDKASRGQTPDIGEAQDGKGQMGLTLPTDSVLGLLTMWQEEWGPLRGKWGLSPFFPFQSFSFPLSYTETHTQTLFF